MRFRVNVHYTIGRSVNIDRFTCSDWESDVGAGVIRFIDGLDDRGLPVISAQYWTPWRIIIAPIIDKDTEKDEKSN